ncbi:chaperonin 10-like protein [Neurospora crassa]|nr:chaperonin 10-like protein [Neurospora crassa]
MAASRTTTALVIPELNGQFELQEVRLNDIQPDEVLVEIEAFGICHTDLSFAAGLLPCRPGAVLGHEGAGKVLSVGSSSTSHLSPGDSVLLSFSHCNSCPSCLSGHPAYCHSFNARNFSGCRPLPVHPDGIVDSSSLKDDPFTDPSYATFLTPDTNKPIFSQFFGQSSFARHTLVHKSCCVKVPPETNLALYAPMGCGMQTGAGAVLNSLGVKPGSSIAVFGVGSVGMAAVMAAAHIAKAKTIIAVDLQASRLELAQKLGATHTVLGNNDKSSGEEMIKKEVRRICPPVGVDYAVDCTGSVAVIKTMIEVLGTRGRAATVGAPGFGKVVGVDVMEHLTYGKEYVGSCEGDSSPKEFIPFLIDQHAKGNFPMDQFVTFYNVKDYKQALEDSHNGKAIKAVLKW